MIKPPASFYHFALDDPARVSIEQTARNFREATGRCMQVPTALFEDLKVAGVDMRNLEPNDSLGLIPPIQG